MAQNKEHEAKWEPLQVETAAHWVADWREHVRRWAQKRRRQRPFDVEKMIAYFERAFESTHPRCAERAWFGTNGGGTLSLLVGHIYLAAAVTGNRDHGLWILLDDDVMPHADIKYSPVKSTLMSVYKLRWARAKSMDVLDAVVKNSALWESFSRASDKILHAPIAADRDEQKRRRSKARLADILAWDAHLSPPERRPVILREFTEPTTDLDTLDERVSQLRKMRSLERPTGEQVPAKQASIERRIHVRNPLVKAWVLIEAKGRCELCQQEAPFKGDDGLPYLEVHHVVQLAKGGPDTVENAVALCPTCHRRLHYAVDRVEHRERLYRQVQRLIRAEPGAVSPLKSPSASTRG